MNNFIELIDKCKAGISLDINEHKSYSQDIEDYIKDYETMGYEFDPEVRKEIIERDAIVELHYYPRTPISFVKVFHWDINELLNHKMEE